MSISRIKFTTPRAALARGFQKVAVPNCERTEENFNGASTKHEYVMKFRRDQHGKFRGLVFATLQDLYDNQEEYESKDVHRMHVKLSIGWICEELLKQGNGSMTYVPKPLDLYNCSQAELEEFWALLEPYAREHLGDARVEQQTQAP